MSDLDLPLAVRMMQDGYLREIVELRHENERLRQLCMGEECRNLNDKWPSLFECSECGYTNYDTYSGSSKRFEYCPNCGRKVTE